MTNVPMSTMLKIKKLLEHSESAKQLGSVEEAATFAAKAQELLVKYKLNLSEVELAEEETTNPIGVGPMFDVTEVAGGSNRAGFHRRAAWLENLTAYICQAHFCQFLISGRTKAIWIVGHKHDREIVEYLLKVLVERGWKMASKHYYEVRATAAKTGLPMPRRPKDSFLNGFALGIGLKLEEMKQALGSKALVLYQRNDKAVSAFVKDYTKGKEKAESLDNNIGDYASYMKGMKAGKEQSLQGGSKDTTKHSTFNNLRSILP